MSNPMPIYSHVVPKSQYRKNAAKTGSNRPQNASRTDFDPLNYNHGGQFHLLNQDSKFEKSTDRKEVRRKEDRRRPQKVDPAEGKVEAYLRQNQVSIRQQQHRHSAVRQAEHRVNLRSLPLNDVVTSLTQDRTPDRHRGFPERERDGAREHRRERDKDRDREYDGEPLSPSRPEPRVRKSTSFHKATEPAIAADKRRFFCREWAFQKIAHCLEQRPVSKTCGALILGDAGSGKTALCQELSSPGQGAQARQQRTLNRRLLARHYLQSNQENTLRPGEFVRSLAMQILSQSSRHVRKDDDGFKHGTPEVERRNIEEERLVNRFKDLGDDGDGEESSKPLLGDSEDQRTDEEDDLRRTRTIDRIHERECYLDSMIDDAQLTHGLRDDLPAILPRAGKPTNPFLTDDTDAKIYENHENVYLRNLSRRTPRLPRQSSEPLKTSDQSENERSKSEKSENSPPKSRIPVSSFRYPNKSDLRSADSSPHKSRLYDDKREGSESREVEYQNILKESEDVAIEKKKDEDIPPPIPSLPVSARTMIANAYYEKLLSDPEVQQALLPQNLDLDPDESFKKALLYPLLEIDPPKQCLFLLVDAIDEGSLTGQQTKEDSSEPSRTVATLLARHQHLFPQWLLLVCTARRHSKQLTKMFTGFRKITLDELQRAHVSADVQRYVLARLDTEPRLRARVSSDSTAAAAAAAALDHLRIKSDGCLLYLEKVLDGVADGFIALREIRDIPGTLNGLYSWLTQRLFHGRRFTKVRLLLDVLLAARCGVTEEMLYKCLLTQEYSVSRDDFQRRLHLLRRILVMDRTTGYLSFFHHSIASWLVDVKHCTRRYLCSPRDGDAAIAMYYTLEARRLSSLEIHNFVLHMTNVEQHLAAQKKSKNSPAQEECIDLHTLTLLWILDSGCDVDAARRRDDAHRKILHTDIVNKNKSEDKEDEPANGETEITSEGAQSPLEALMMPSLQVCPARWPNEARVMRTLLELTGGGSDLPEVLSEPAVEEEKALPEEDTELDPNLLIELATEGDEERLELLLKKHPSPPAAALSGALGAAARGGRGRCAAALLRAGAAPDAPDAEGRSPLRAAAWAGHAQVVEVLLEYNCDVDCVDADNRTALRAAAWSGHESVVSLLLGAGASPARPDAEGRTALIAAAYMGHAAIVRALLDAGAEVNHADEDGRTALAVASLCASGAACVSILLERGADVNLADRDRATPLLVAAFEGHTEICELLLEAEADIEAADSAGRTALWAAASAGHGHTVRLLLFWGACVDNMDPDGRTVLSTAAAQGNVEVVRQLLDRGLDEHHRDNSGWTPLHYAAFEGHISVCEALLEAGAKVDEADNDGKGPLMLAAQEGHAGLVDLLLSEWTAPPDQRAHDGKTALRLAALEGQFETVRALFARGADVDAPDADRRTTLYVLALDNRLAMARYLITECGANVDSRDAEGRTPLHVSAWQGHTEMVNLLIKVGGAAVDGRDRCGRTALHAAAWRGRGAALRALLAHGACPAAVCAQGATPLGISAQEGHEDCVLWLLQHGADPLQADHCGRTPAKVSWRAGHANICRLLERWAAPSAPALAAAAPALPGPAQPTDTDNLRCSPEYKRRSVHSSNSTKSSSNLTASSNRSHSQHDTSNDADALLKANRAHLSLSFTQQIARVGRRERDRDDAIPENHVVEKDSKLRSYMANERDADIKSSGCGRDRDRRRDERHGCERDSTSPLYASPPRSPVSDVCSPTQPCDRQPGPAPATVTDPHFNRDTHMRIILGRERAAPDRADSKAKRNGIVTNPAMRLVNNVRNGLDSAAANIRRTGVALAASASSNNPAVKTNAFQWRRETPL